MRNPFKFDAVWGGMGGPLPDGDGDIAVSGGD